MARAWEWLKQIIKKDIANSGAQFFISDATKQNN